MTGPPFPGRLNPGLRGVTSSRRWLAVLLGAALIACGGESVTTEPPSSEPGGMIERGAELYRGNCAQCHGDDLRGTDQGPSFLSIVYEPGHHGDGAFLVAVTRGVPAHHWNFGPMPPIPGLDAEEVAAIVAFVRDVQQREGFEPYPP